MFRIGTGPAVIVMAEVRGITSKVAAFARLLLAPVWDQTPPAVGYFGLEAASRTPRGS